VHFQNQFIIYAAFGYRTNLYGRNRNFFSATQVFIRKTRSHSKKAVLIKKISTLSICAFLFFSAMLIYVVRYRPAIDKFIGVRFDPGTRAEYFTGEGIPVLVSHVKGFDRLFYKIEGYIAEPHRLIRIQKRDGLEISVPLSKKSGLLLPVYKVLIESRWERTDITPGSIIKVKAKPGYLSETKESFYRDYQISMGIIAVLRPERKNILTAADMETAALSNTSKINSMDFTAEYSVGIKLQQSVIKTLEHIRSRLEARAGADFYGLGYGLLTGNKEQIPPEVRDAFRQTGTYHVLAVSGMHAAILTAVFFSLLRFAGLQRRLAWIILFAAVLPVYLVFTGLQISIIRTYLMLLLAYAVISTGRRTELLYIFLFVFLLYAFAIPAVLFSVSFQLSFSAVFGILIALRFIRIRGIKNPVLVYCLVSFGAQFGTAPFVIYHFGYINYFSLLYNAVLMFIIPLIMIYAVLTAALPAGAGYFFGRTLAVLTRLVYYGIPVLSFEHDAFHLPWRGNIRFASVLFLVLTTAGIVASVHRFRAFHYLLSKIAGMKKSVTASNALLILLLGVTCNCAKPERPDVCINISTSSSDAKIFLNTRYCGTGCASNVHALRGTNHIFVTGQSVYDYASTEVISESSNLRIELIPKYGKIMIGYNRRPDLLFINRMKSEKIDELTLPFGEYRITAYRNGFKFNSAEVKINSVDTLKINLLLSADPPWATLTVRSKLHHPEIFIDGMHFGSTPLIFERLEPGSYTLTVRHSGYPEKQYSIALTPGEKRVFDADDQ